MALDGVLVLINLVLLLVVVPAAILIIGYFIIKKAVKNGILEAYKELHKD